MQQPIVLVKHGVVPWLARAALPIAKGSPVELGMQSWPAFGENGVVCNGSFGKRTCSKVYAWGVISEMGLPASEDCCNDIFFRH